MKEYWYFRIGMWFMTTNQWVAQLRADSPTDWYEEEGE